MSFVCGGLEHVFRKRSAARSGGEDFDCVDACVKELPGRGCSLWRVGDFGSWQLHYAHHAENLVRGQSAWRDEAFACRANFWAGDFARVDAAAKAARVLPDGAGVEDTGEAVFREHVLELAAEFRGGDVGYIGPFSFEEVNMAVPEAGGDGEVEAVEDVRGFGKLHLRSVADGNNFFVLNEDNTVANGFFCGAGVDCGSYQCRILVRGVWRRVQEKVISWWKGAWWDILA